MAIRSFYYIASCFALLLFSACEKNVQVDVPEYEDRLAIFSHTIAGEEPIRVLVGKSISIVKYNGQQGLAVTNATAELYTDGVYTEAMTYDPNIFSLKAVTTPQSGKTYMIKVTAPGFTHVAEATATVPSKVIIETVKVIPSARVNGNGEQLSEVIITFNDPAASDDCYMLGYLPPSIDSFNQGGYWCMSTVDPSVEKLNIVSVDNNLECFDVLLFNDDLFDATTKELRFFMPWYAVQPLDQPGFRVNPQVVLTHISEAHFRYLKTSRYADFNQGNPFAEPTNIYTNVKNGTGIFSLANRSIKDVK